MANKKVTYKVLHDFHLLKPEDTRLKAGDTVELTPARAKKANAATQKQAGVDVVELIEVEDEETKESDEAEK